MGESYFYILTNVNTRSDDGLYPFIKLDLCNGISLCIMSNKRLQLNLKKLNQVKKILVFSSTNKQTSYIIISSEPLGLLLVKQI